jgi:hypothetical protein
MAAALLMRELMRDADAGSSGWWCALVVMVMDKPGS